MKKIPTIFERDWNGDKSRVIDKPNDACEWVFAGEGQATIKMDGTSCLIRGNSLYKRREFKEGQPVPDNFEEADFDAETGKHVGWVPVEDTPENCWHIEAFKHWQESGLMRDGTCELVGPKIQGNPENYQRHGLVYHDGVGLVISPEPLRTFDGIKEFLSGNDMEGIVYHHPDGRMAKIKKRDFGLNRKPDQPSNKSEMKE